MARILTALAASVCLVAVVAPAHAQERTYSVQAGTLKSALNAYVRQSGRQLLFRGSEMSGVLTKGARGNLTADQALDRILAGTGFRARADASGAIAIIRNQPVTTSLGSAHGEASAAGDAAIDQSADIIVTAQKRLERIQDVPIPVTVVKAVQLTENSQLRVQDYYSSIPGLNLSIAGNASEPVVSIRGITTGGNANPTVGIVVDDVPYGASIIMDQANFIPDIDPGDLSSVEVLRGPQGTLYGASSIGGLIKFVTIEPSVTAFSGRVQAGTSAVSEGKDLGYNVRGSVNVPLADTLAVRATGFVARDPGYVDNVETGEKDVNNRLSKGGRIALLWEPSNQFSVKLSALYQDSKRKGPDDVDVTLGDDPQQRFLEGTGGYRRKSQAYSATVKGKLGGVELTSITGYGIDEIDDTIDSTTFLGGLFTTFAQSFFNADRVVTVVTGKVEKFSQEVRADIPVGDSIDLLLGGFYTDEKSFRSNDTRAALSSGAVLGSLFDNAYGNPGKFEEYAAFANATVRLSDRFDVQLGGRFSWNKQTLQIVRSGPLSALFLGVDPSIIPGLQSKDSPFIYQVTPRFKISPDVMVYARAASGYRPGGPNLACGVPTIPCSYGSDTVRNYEVGLKASTLGNTLSVDASLYTIDWKDIQISGINAPGGFGTYTANVARARSRGFELSLDYRPTKQLTLSGWIAYNDAELRDAIPTGAIVGNPGDRLPYSSRYSGNISFNYDIPVSDDATAYIGGKMIYVGDRFGNFQATPARSLFPAYTQFDARAGVRYTDWTVNLFVNNITDKRGVLRSGLDAALDPNYVNFIQPRTIGLNISRTF